MRVATAIALTIVLALPGAALGERGKDQQPPVFTSGVSLVLLPVFVVDRQGRAVRGLRAEDFEVLEDGKRAEIVSFRYVDTTDADEQETLREAPAARRRFLFLFDKSFTDLSGLNRARLAARTFVRTGLASSDLAAVATFDVSNGMRIAANFTEDRALLGHAIETLGVPQLAHISDPLALAANLQATDIETAGSSAEEPLPQALLDSVTSVLVRQIRAAEREQYRSQVEALIGGLADLARGLRNVEGRKQVLYFSAGFDAQVLVGESGYSLETTTRSVVEGRLWEVDGLARYGDSRVRDLMAEATRALSASDAVVHTIDVTGLGTDNSLTALTPRATGTRDTGTWEGLNLLSAETGGRFFRNTNDLAPVLEEMAEMTSRYYLLGFQPASEKGPGEFHKLKVKVARKGVKLSHRGGYHERPAPAADRTVLQRQFEAAQLVVTGAGASDLRFASLCLPFPAAEDDRQTLGLVLQVPKESLSWQAGRPLALEVYAYAVDETGAVRDHLAQLARVDPGVADPDGDAVGLSVYGTLSVPAGKYTVRLMVQERESGASGVQFIDVTVPPYVRSGFLLPPVVMDQASRWVAMEMGGADRPPFPFQVGGEPFLPRATLEVSGSDPERLVLIAYEPDRAGDPAAGVEIRSSMVDGDGQKVPSGRLRIEKVHRDGNGRRTYVLGYTPEPLARGDYTLRIALAEGASHLESYSLVKVRPTP